MVTITELNERIKKAQKQIDSGKLKGWPLTQAKNVITNSTRAIRAKRGEVKKSKPQSTKKTRKAKSTNQAFLPGFLDQEKIVRIEELLTQYKEVNQMLVQISAELKEKIA